MALDEQNDYIYPLLKKSIIAAIMIGIALWAILFFFSTETYSALYLVPGSYSNNAIDGNVSFGYGVISTEAKTTNYIVKFSVGDAVVDQREFTLAGGERWEEENTISLPQATMFPTKVSILLIEENGLTEEVHFWLKG